MALKIRCPHCRAVLLAQDHTVAEQKLCPVCAQQFTVPIPYREPDPARPDVASRCPACDQPVAPGTSICKRCLIDITTQERLPLRQRLRYISPQRLGVLAGALCLTALAGFVAVHTWLLPALRTPIEAPPEPAPHELQAAALALADRLLAAATPAELQEAHDAALRGGTGVPAAVSLALDRSLREPTTLQLQRNQRAAIDVLTTTGDSVFIETLTRCAAQPALHDAALHARSRLGDAATLDELQSGWEAALRRQIFLEGLQRNGFLTQVAAADAALRSAREQAAEYAESLKRLAQFPDAPVIDRLADTFWSSWAWLGQGRGQRVAEALFQIAQPPQQDGLGGERVREEVRGARRTLDLAAGRAPPTARAVVALVLAQCAPQYRSARQRAIDGAAAGLSSAAATDQQRITWALAELEGRPFGRTTGSSHPADVRPQDVADALAWAGERTRSSSPQGARPAAAAGGGGSRLAPPPSERRVVTPRRQLERDLLIDLRGDWPAVAAGLQRWRKAGLGFTPRVAELLSPRQRSPHLPALAAAMLLAVENDAPDAAAALVLWREAADQPAWVRGLAHTALSALEARRGRLESTWPAGLDARLVDELPADAPAWSFLRDVIAAGGPPLLQRLKDASPASLPEPLRTKMLRMTEPLGPRGPKESTR